MGIVGMIIALPFTSIILSYYKRFIKKGDDSELKDTPRDFEKTS
jgi:predicted PurR-regulated permease PerM